MLKGRVLTGVAAVALLTLIGGGVWFWMELGETPRAEPIDEALTSQAADLPAPEASPEPPPPTPEPDGDDAQREASPRPPAQPPQEEPHASDPAEETDDDATPPATEGKVVLVGRVVTPAGEPVHGAHVLLVTQRMADEQLSKLQVGSWLFREDRGLVRSDAEGRFRMVLGEWWQAALSTPVAAAPASSSYATGSGEAIDVEQVERMRRSAEAGSSAYEVDAGTVSLREGGTVRGRVVDNDGMPLAGARVRLAGNRWRQGSDDSAITGYAWQEGGPAATTDEDGRYRLLGVPDDEVVVAARKQGYRQAYAEDVHAVAGKEVEAAEIVLPPAITVITRVTDAHELPISGARVRLSYSRIHPRLRSRTIEAAHEAPTDERGEVRFEDVEQRRFTVVVDAPGFVQEILPRVVQDEREEIQVTLRPETTIRFRPVDASSGEPLYPPSTDERERQRLMLQYQRQDDDAWASRISRGWLELEEDGTLVTDAAPVGEFELSFRTRTHGTWTEQLRIEAGQTYDLGDISMEGGVRFVVEVFESSGEPLAGAEVRTRRITREENRMQSGSHDSGMTDEDGRWESQPVIGTHIGISARHPDWTKAYVEQEIDPHIPTSTVQVTMSKPATIEGRVTNVSNEPVIGATVYLSVHDDEQRPLWRPPTPQTNTDDQGRYAFTDVPPGAYRVTTQRPRRTSRGATSPPDADVRPGDRVTVDLSTAVEYSGTVSWHNEALAANLALKLIDTAERDDPVVARMRTDGQGQFSFRLEEAQLRGSYVLRVEAEHNRSFDLRLRMPREGGDLGELRLPNLSHEARVSLRIQLVDGQSGAPVRGRVRLRTPGILSYWQGEYEQTEHIDWLLDVDGDVLLDDLPPARYEVSLLEEESTSNVVASERETLLPGTEGEVTLARNPMAEVRLLVRFEGASQGDGFRAGARVSLSPSEDDQDGIQESTFLPAGHARTVTLTADVEYTARFRARGYETKRIQFTPTEGETRKIEVTLKEAD